MHLSNAMCFPFCYYLFDIFGLRDLEKKSIFKSKYMVEITLIIEIRKKKLKRIWQETSDTLI